MFDSPQCLRPFTGIPLSFDWGMWNGLKLPLILGLALGLVAGLGWIIQRLGQEFSRHQVFVGLLGGMVVTIALLSVAERGLTLFLPSDPGTPADAIVILGRGTEWRASRVALGTELWRSKRAPIVFVSGIADAPKMLPMLSAAGVPVGALDGENCSLTTAENGLFTAAILQARGVKKIILVTDRAHIWRSLQDYQFMGFQVIPVPSDFPVGMGWADRTILVAREYFFLLTSGIGELATGQRVSSWNSPGSEALVKLAKAYGRLQPSTKKRVNNFTR